MQKHNTIADMKNLTNSSKHKLSVIGSMIVALALVTVSMNKQENSYVLILHLEKILPNVLQKPQTT